MNLYIKIIFGLMLSNLSLLPGQNHSSEISKLETEALKKLTNQLRSNTPVNISEELTKLHDIAAHQAEKKTDSFQKASTIFGAAAIGALLAKATEQPLIKKSQPISYQLAQATAETETKRMITGLEATAIASLFPSGTSILYGALAIGSIFVLYEFNKGLHAPCNAKLQLTKHSFETQIQAMRNDIDRKQEEMRKTLTSLQTENEQIAASLTNAHQEVQAFKAIQQEINGSVGTVGTALSEVLNTLSSMSTKAHWDLRDADPHAARKGLQDQLKAAQQEEELNRTIQEAELDLRRAQRDVFLAKLEADRAAEKPATSAPFDQKKSIHHTPQPLAAGAQNISAGVFPPRGVVESVESVGCFGCLPRSKNRSELR